MSVTFTCRLDKQGASFYDASSDELEMVSIKQFEQYIGKRQFHKLSSATHIAGAMYHKYAINERVRELGGDPNNTPLVICNRFANWDYVADITCSSAVETMNRMNSYVATAWFPATLQGYLTIHNGNVGEAITLSTEDTGMICATINSLRSTNKDSRRLLVLGTFECVPSKIGGIHLAPPLPMAFGAISLIQDDDTPETIRLTVLTHQGMYAHA